MRPRPRIAPLPDHWQLSEGAERWKSDALFTANVIGAPDAALGVAIDKDFVLDGDKYKPLMEGW